MQKERSPGRGRGAAPGLLELLTHAPVECSVSFQLHVGGLTLHAGGLPLLFLHELLPPGVCAVVSLRSVSFSEDCQVGADDTLVTAEGAPVHKTLHLEDEFGLGLEPALQLSDPLEGVLRNPEALKEESSTILGQTSFFILLTCISNYLS